MQSRRQHQSLWLCLFAALLPFPVNKSGSPLTLVGAEHKLLACEGSVLRDRLTTAAVNKASVFTGFMGETRKERRQQEGGGGQDAGEMWLSASTARGKK